MPSGLDSSSRTRIPVACAECRRLKLKCDKNKPCSSCLRRGCASICPQGRMVSKGTRFILANTEQLHEKIDSLIGRVRQLESALEASHALHSNEPHPLLWEELRLIASPIDSAAGETEPTVKEEDLTENMGTLTLDNHGSRYFGSTGAFAYLWRDADGPDGLGYKRDEDVSAALASLPPELSHMAHAFPMRLPTRDRDMSDLSTWILENCLPPFPEAWSLFESYWEHYAWHFTPVARADFVEQILSPLYHKSPDNGDKPLGHRLALLFMVFAIGDLLDLTRPIEPSTGLRYYLLGRASLCLDPVFDSPTVTALQAMYLMVIFLMMSRGINEPEHAWVLSGINLKLALTLGLQHDANKFHLPAAEVQSRKQAVVAVVCTETWQARTRSLESSIFDPTCSGPGRPPSLTFASFDWALPQDPQDTTVDSPMSDRNWAGCFIRDCVSKVLDIVVGNRASSYSAILQLDAKIREYYVPPPAPTDPQDPAELGVSATMRRVFVGILKESTLLFLHRRCFAIALRDSPDDPLKSPFAPSVMSCHRSAASFISRMCMMHQAMPEIMLRIWFIWPNVFVATLVLGSIVARSPGCSLASSALLELEMACQLWESAADTVCGAKVSGIVKQLKQKAFMAFAQSKAPRDPLSLPPSGIEVLDEIHALGGGGPRVISITPKSGSGSAASSPYSSEQNAKSSSPHSPPSSIGDYPGVRLDNEPVPKHVPPFSNNVVDTNALFSSMGPAFDFSSNFSSQAPGYPGDTLPTDFNDIFRSIGASAPAQAPPAGYTILEELGLGEGWQPMIDHFGL